MSKFLARVLILANKKPILNSTSYRSLSVLTNNNQFNNNVPKNNYQNKVSSFVNSKIITSCYASNYSTGELTKELHDRIDKLVKNDSVVVFMKGTAQQPRCGFSKAVVDILTMHGAKFEHHDVLQDEDLRSGIKEYSSWPTIPQIFFKGEFIGGCDILLEMHRSGELVDELEKIGIKSKLVEEEQSKK